MKRRAVTALLVATTVILTGLTTGCSKTANEYPANASVGATQNETSDYAYEETVTSDYSEDCEMPKSSEAEFQSEDVAYAACDEVYDSDCDEEAMEISDYAQMNVINSKTATDSYLESAYDYDIESTEQNSEEYSELEEEGYKSVLKAPLSTFAADVDTAAYSNFRRMVESGYTIDTIPENAIRVEEFINYFNYDYKEPKGSEPFSINATIGDCSWNRDAKLVSLGFKTEDIDFEDTPASNLVFLIDVSGSMYDENKLPLLQKSFCMLTDNLRGVDRISIVTYASSDEVVIKGAKGSDKRKIKNAINSLEAGGSTYGSAGIITAYEIAEKYFIKGGNNRVILATDGDLNVGVTSEEALEELIAQKKESGIFLSVLGFGTGNIKDNKMEILADKGNGNYAYIDTLKEAKKVLVDEISANLLTICKDVKFQVEFNPEVVSKYKLIGYANRTMAAKDFNDDKKDGGEIGAGHQVTVLYEVILNDDYSFGEEEIDPENLRYADEFKKASSKVGKVFDKNDEILTVSIRYKKPSEDKSNLLSYPITFACYDTKPSDDFIFQSAVAEFAILARATEEGYDSDFEDVLRKGKDIDWNDEDKEEFFELVEQVIR